MDRKISKSEISQKFNLKKLLGYEPSEAQKELFYSLAVDKIVNRTVEGKDIDGKKFTRYSKQYAQKKGVSRNSVDLVLNGDMLSSFEQSQTKQKNILKIKIDDETEAKKAFNHITGDTLPKRDFFGFKSEKDVKDIIREVDSAKKESAQENISEAIGTLAELRAAVRQISIETE